MLTRILARQEASRVSPIEADAASEIIRLRAALAELHNYIHTILGDIVSVTENAYPSAREVRMAIALQTIRDIPLPDPRSAQAMLLKEIAARAL